MADYTAADLWNDIDVGTRFRMTVAMGGKGTLEVTEVHETLGPNGRWAFDVREVDTDEAFEWRYEVRPDRGGPNGGVVKTHWFDSNGNLAGHHEVYPRAINILHPEPTA